MNTLHGLLFGIFEREEGGLAAFPDGIEQKLKSEQGLAVPRTGGDQKQIAFD